MVIALGCTQWLELEQQELEELRTLFLQVASEPVNIVSLSGLVWTSLQHGDIKAVGLLTWQLRAGVPANKVGGPSPVMTPT